MSSQAWYSLGCMIALTVVSGCGGGSHGTKMPKDLPSTTPVTGIVTVDGAPAPKIQVILLPAANVEMARPPHDEDFGGFLHTGVTDDSGKFSITTHTTNDGAPAGEYVVLFYKRPPKRINDSNRADAEAKIAFNAKFATATTSEHKATIKGGTATDLGKYDLKTQ